MIFDLMIFNHLSFDHPRFFFLFLLFIPVLILVIYRYVKQQKVFFVFLQKYNETENNRFYCAA